MSPRGPAWPDTQDLRLIRAAVLPPGHASAAWEDWVAAGGDLDVVEGEAHRLLPQLWQNLAASGGEDPELGRLSGIYRHAWVMNHRLLQRAGRAVAALEDEGVETLLLKGGAIVAALGRGVGTRPMSDLDVLVRPRDAERALDVLSRLGYHRRSTVPIATLMRSRHSVALHRDDADQIDLHWSALVVPGDDELVWRAATPTTLATARTRAPAPAHQLLIVCAHGLSWAPSPVRWVADAALILRSGAPIDWDLLVETAADRDVTLETRDALRLLRDELALPVPQDVLARLAAAPVSRATRAARTLRRIRPLRPRLVLGWLDVYRALRRRPYSEAGAPPDLLEHTRVILGQPSRRALLPWLLRRVIRGPARR
jgi:hypothetical protein